MHKLTALIFAFGFALASSTAFAMGGEGGGGSPYEEFEILIQEKKFDEAIEGLNEALAEREDDAELLNLIAYSHRQLKRYEIALNYYQKALEIEPNHRGANEYLGELYLHMGQLDKALERRDVIDADCFFRCKELKALEAAIEEYRKQNPTEG